MRRARRRARAPRCGSRFQSRRCRTRVSLEKARQRNAGGDDVLHSSLLSERCLSDRCADGERGECVGAGFRRGDGDAAACAGRRRRRALRHRRRAATAPASAATMSASGAPARRATAALRRTPPFSVLSPLRTASIARSASAASSARAPATSAVLARCAREIVGDERGCGASRADARGWPRRCARSGRPYVRPHPMRRVRPDWARRRCRVWRPPRAAFAHALMRCEFFSARMRPMQQRRRDRKLRAG